jgi:hypothetical protein
MAELTCTFPVPRTSEELEAAIQQYRNSDLHGVELFCQWHAICEASLHQEFNEPKTDAVLGEDSY